MAVAKGDPQQFLQRSLASDRIHSAYLFAGTGEAPREAALAFVRGLVCEGKGPRPCEACTACIRSARRGEIQIDGAGKRGPQYRHVGDHPDLLWVERGAEDTRIRIGQVRAIQSALHLRSIEGGRRAVVIADAEWMNQGAQNALLKLLEEPPERTTIVLVTTSSAGLLATVRSRCQKIAFRSAVQDSPPDPERRELLDRLESLASAAVSDVLDWAEEFRGPRAAAAPGVERLIEVGSAWLRAAVWRAVGIPDRDVRPSLDAFRALASCRKALVQRNANPQMVAERALFTLRGAANR